MRDLGDYEALGRKTNREEMRLATESPNPVSDFMCGQYACVGHRTKGARVLAGSTLRIGYKNIPVNFGGAPKVPDSGK